MNQMWEKAFMKKQILIILQVISNNLKFTNKLIKKSRRMILENENG